MCRRVYVLSPHALHTPSRARDTTPSLGLGAAPLRVKSAPEGLGWRAVYGFQNCALTQFLGGFLA